MEPTTPRRLVALIASATLLASLTVAAVAAPVSAARPTCDGKVATIVSKKKVINGTNRADVIVARGNKDNLIYGKGGRDRICAGFGDDRVLGGPGHDRIFGGSGDDHLFGQTGRDDLFGFAGTDVMNGGAHDDFLSGGPGDDRMAGGPGNDVVRGGLGPDSIGGDAGDDRLHGQQGNDEINGGDGVDVCVQGAGSGPITDCEEQFADLSMEVFGPGSGTAGSAPFMVTVFNRGPQATSYRLVVDEENQNATCDPPWEAVTQAFPPLQPLQWLTLVFEPGCTVHEGESWVEVIATVLSDGEDPNGANDVDMDRATLN